MDRIFKCHCSCYGKIAGRVGLTEKQLARMDELTTRKYSDSAKPLTQNMEDELKMLQHEHANPQLPATAITYLRQWYADDKEEVYSKYLDKGRYVEDELIDFMAVELGLGLAEKNTDQREDDYFIGTCDVNAPGFVVDTKAAWDNTLLQTKTDSLESDYEWQIRGYMRLWDKQEGVIFYGLVNTPPEVNYDREVTYDHIPASQRWVAYKVKRDLKIEQEMVERVKLCRTWLEGYDKLVKSRLGKLHEI